MCRDRLTFSFLSWLNEDRERTEERERERKEEIVERDRERENVGNKEVALRRVGSARGFSVGS